MKKFSVLIANRHATSISLEEEFYLALTQIAANKKMTLSALITMIDETRTKNNLSSAIRVFILKNLQQQLTQNQNKSISSSAAPTDVSLTD